MLGGWSSVDGSISWGDLHSLSGGTNGISGSINPGSSETLHDSEKKHEVYIEEVVNHVEVGETPVEGEEDGGKGTRHAKNQSDKLTWHILEHWGVLHHSGGGLQEGEGGVDTQSEESDGKNQSPCVGSWHSLDGGWVGNEGKSDGGGLVGDWGTNTLEVSNNGEDSESSEETNETVDHSNLEGISNNWLVLLVERGIRCHGSHANSEREENLTASFGPHLTI